MDYLKKGVSPLFHLIEYVFVKFIIKRFANKTTHAMMSVCNLGYDCRI